MMKIFRFNCFYKTNKQGVKLGTVLLIACLFSLGASVFFMIGKPLFYFAALTGTALILPIIKYPRLGFYLTVATLPLDEVGKLGKIFPMVDISIVKVFALLTILGWLINICAKKMRFVWHPVATVFLLYLLVGVLSLVDAVEFKRGLQELVIQGTTILFFIMTFNLLKTKKHLLIALVCFSVVSTGTFAWAGIQRFLPSAVISERVGWLEAGEATSGVETSNIESKSLGGTVRRSTGTTAHSNVLGASTAFLLPILIVFLRFTRQPIGKAVILGGVACCLLGAVVSLSRTGLLSYLPVVTMLVVTGLIVITPVRIMILVLAIGISTPFMPVGVSRIFDLTNYFSSKSVSVSERYKLWNAAGRAFLDHPINGFGIGNNRGIFDYYYNTWNPGLLTVHNTYLQVLIETGIFGLMALCLFFYKIVRLFRQARKMFLQQGDDLGAILSLALMISVISFLFMGAIAFDFMRVGFKNMWFMIGCSVVLYHIALEQSRQSLQDNEDVTVVPEMQIN